MPRQTDFRNAVIGYLLQRDGDKCVRCSNRFTKFSPPQVDHKLPKSKGGTDDLYNLQLIHGYCNQIKGSGTDLKFMSKEFGLSSYLENQKYKLLKTTLLETNGVIAHAAKKLKISRKRIYEDLKRYHLSKDPNLWDMEIV